MTDCEIIFFIGKTFIRASPVFTKKDFMFSTNPECDWLTHNDPADAFVDYVSDNLDDNNFVELFKSTTFAHGKNETNDYSNSN